MVLQVHIAGTGLDVRQMLLAGEPALILGRDSDCGVCLPDPQRSISRRHLSVWNDGGQLHFHVLSVVNGVTTAALGELLPGARGVLAPGDVLALAQFRITVHPLSDTASAQVPAPDPWLELQRLVAQLVPSQGAETMPGMEADPFGDSGFHGSFAPAAGSVPADSAQPAQDLRAFFAGLGVDGPQGLTNGELETLGRLVRIAVERLVQGAAAADPGTGGEDRTISDASKLLERYFAPAYARARMRAKRNTPGPS